MPHDDDDRDDTPRPRRGYGPPPPKSGGGGKVLVIVLSIVGAVVLVCGGLGVGLFFAVGKVRESAARLSTSQSQHLVAISAHNYESVYGTLPAVYATDPKGGPPPAELSRRLSWRASLLPYMEYDSTYMQIDFTKAWDDPANRLATDSNVKYFGDVLDAADNQTRFRCFYDNGAVFSSDPTKKSILARISDGSQNTILFVEAGGRVPWAQCNEFRFDPNATPPPLGHPQRTVFLACMADGSVKAVRKSIDPAVLVKAIHTSDGSPGPDFDK